MLLQPSTLEEAFKQAELIGRVSHRSEDRITEDSYNTFLAKMEKLEHFSTLEFAPMYLKLKLNPKNYKIYKQFKYDPYSYACIHGCGIYISTNYRVLVNKKLKYLTEYWVAPTKYHKPRTTFKSNTSIKVSREFNRHRKLSPLEESTRYCNYSENGNLGMKFCPPTKLAEDEKYNEIMKPLREHCEIVYNHLIDAGYKAEDASNALLLETSTTVYHSGYNEDWEHFLSLRDTTSAYHGIRELAKKIKESL